MTSKAPRLDELEIAKTTRGVFDDGNRDVEDGAELRGLRRRAHPSVDAVEREDDCDDGIRP